MIYCDTVKKSGNVKYLPREDVLTPCYSIVKTVLRELYSICVTEIAQYIKKNFIRVVACRFFFFYSTCPARYGFSYTFDFLLRLHNKYS